MQTPLDDITWPVRTERLVLRTATPQDAGPTWDFRRLEAVNRWLTRAPRSLAEHRERFLDPERLAVTVVVELDGAVIGDLMLRVEDAWTQAEVTGQGGAVHAELGLRRVTASCFAGNEASWRLMERVGMRRELHAVRESLHRSGDWLDVYGYALLAEEWDATPTAQAGRADARGSRVPETATFVARGHVSVEGS